MSWFPVRLISRVVIAAVAAQMLARAAHAATFFVSPCGQDAWIGVNAVCSAPLGPKRTIQAAINAASNGDTVVVLPGTYIEKIDLDGKAITLMSSGGPGVTTIDGNDSGPVVTCNSGETAATVIQGFRITSGSTTVNGGGMLNVLSSPTVIGCTFSGNHTSGNGAAIACFLASPTFNDCIIAFSQAGDEPPAANSGMGAGIYAVSSNITLTETFMQTCYATGRGALMALINSIADISDCDFYTSGTTFSHGEGGGIFADNSTVTIDNCLFDGVNAWSPDSDGGSLLAINNSQITCTATTFLSATAEVRGGAASLYDSEGTFIGCEFSELGADAGGAIYVNGGSYSATLCGFDGCSSYWSGGGAIHAFNAVLDLGLCTFTDNFSEWFGGAAHGIASEVNIQGCTFSGNTGSSRGGAVNVSNCALTADSCTFDNNDVVEADSSRSGGGLLISADANTPPSTVSNCTFTENSAGVGGGLYVIGNGVTINSCTIQSNVASWLGGGAYLTPLSSNYAIRMNDCQILQNQAGQSGGGIEMEGSGRTFVHDTVFTGNSAQNGGGARCFQNPAVFSACRFNNNTASVRGAAVDTHGVPSGVELFNCVVHNNTAPAGGGAIAQSGEGFWLGKLRIANCTIANNNGGGIQSAGLVTDSTVANSIVWGNPNGGQFIGAMPAVRYTNVQGGAPGLGNMNASPLFVGALGGNYRLLATSPCIDAGNNWGVASDTLDLDGDSNVGEFVPFDFDGSPRIADNLNVINAGCSPLDAVVDMGAFESAGSPPAVPVELGDVNGDGVVDINDMLEVIVAWGPCAGNCCLADLDLNGSIDIDDLLTVIINWT